jgi:hypothetical protein
MLLAVTYAFSGLTALLRSGVSEKNMLLSPGAVITEKIGSCDAQDRVQKHPVCAFKN